MNSEARAATALLLYSGTLTLAIVLGILHTSGGTVKGLLAFGLAVTLVWSLGPTLLRLLTDGKHSS